MNAFTLGMLALAAGAAFAAKEPLEDAVTQNVQTDAYTRWDPLFKKYAQIHNVQPAGGVPGWVLMKATAWVESDLGRHPRVARGLAVPEDVEGSTSDDKKSWGLMQITLPTANDFRSNTTAVDLNNAELSVELAARIMARNIRYHPGNLEYQVRAYNGGPGFLKTKQGLSDTPAYWAKVKSKIDKILAKGE